MHRTGHELASSVFLGASLALLLGLLVFVLGSKTHFVTAYLAPGVFISGLPSPVIPSTVVYWIEPDGGPIAFLLLAAICSVAFWSALFATVFYRRRRRRRPLELR